MNYLNWTLIKNVMYEESMANVSYCGGKSEWSCPCPCKCQALRKEDAVCLHNRQVHDALEWITPLLNEGLKTRLPKDLVSLLTTFLVAPPISITDLTRVKIPGCLWKDVREERCQYCYEILCFNQARNVAEEDDDQV